MYTCIYLYKEYTFFVHPRCILTHGFCSSTMYSYRFLGRKACGNVLWLQLFLNGPYISKKGSRNQHGTTCLGRLISLPKFGEVSTLDEQARCYCLTEEQPVNIHVHLVRHKSRWAPVLGRKMAVKGLENQLLRWNLDYQILVKWLPVFPFTKLLRLVALQALDGGPFQSFQHKGAEVIPNTNGEEKHYLVCVGRQILPMHRNQLQLVAVPKVDTWICTNKNGWGGRPVWGWEFPSFPNQIHQALKAVILLQQLNWQSRSENSSVPWWRRWQGPALGMEPKWGCDNISRCVFWACDFLNLHIHISHTKKRTGKWQVKLPPFVAFLMGQWNSNFYWNC